MKRRIVMATAAGFLILAAFLFSSGKTYYFRGDYFSQDAGDPDDISEGSPEALSADGDVDVSIGSGGFIWQEPDISVYLSGTHLTYSDVLIAVGSEMVFEGSVTFDFSDGTEEVIQLDVLSGTSRIKINKVDGKITHFSAELTQSRYELGPMEALEDGKFKRLSANTFMVGRGMHAVILDDAGMIIDEVITKKREMVTTYSGARYYREVKVCRKSD